MQQPFLHLLPHDVLCELFLLCVKSTPNPCLPVILSQVCRSWRSTALMSPALWTNVVFRMSHPQQRHLRPRAFIKRSRRLRISVHIYVDCQPTRCVGNIISHNAPCLRSLTLTSQNRELILDSIGFVPRMPFHSMELFHAAVPGGLNFQVVRQADHAVPFFTPYPTSPYLDAPGYHDFLRFSWNVQNVTSLSFEGLSPREGPYGPDVCNPPWV
ncbi:hypothetical protein B0H17DRAFT_131595 [Mycena rosella]|uniref:F-box domain-containing protein n=1 Tax=Mycena rosella TaxID=1033263 RepID=A0AAD7D2X6_MYCRO|nr:hypothetical protein B0H17DRAFT_131595 [Mycena rosella]